MTNCIKGLMDPTINIQIGFSVNIRSMQVEELGKMWVGSEISFCKPKILLVNKFSQSQNKFSC